MKSSPLWNDSLLWVQDFGPAACGSTCMLGKVFRIAFQQRRKSGQCSIARTAASFWRFLDSIDPAVQLDENVLRT